MELVTALKRLAAFLLLAFLTQLVVSCAATSDLPAALSQPVDATVQQQLERQLNVQHLKIKGNVTVQLGTGNSNTDATRAHGQVAGGQGKAQDYSKAGQHGGALATEPGASAGATTRTGVPAWSLGVGVLVVVLLLLLGLALKKRSWPFT